MVGKSDNIFVSVLEKGEVFCLFVVFWGEGGGIYSDTVALFTTTTNLSPAVSLKATVLLIPLPPPPPPNNHFSPANIPHFVTAILQSQCT